MALRSDHVGESLLRPSMNLSREKYSVQCHLKHMIRNHPHMILAKSRIPAAELEKAVPW
jgi:hypothetical protein